VDQRVAGSCAPRWIRLRALCLLGRSATGAAGELAREICQEAMIWFDRLATNTRPIATTVSAARRLPSPTEVQLAVPSSQLLSRSCWFCRPL
jgi:hypothetical protein